MSDNVLSVNKAANKKRVVVKAKWCLTKCGQGNSAEAKRAATAILEVMAGMRTPTQAAGALGMSVMRYYQVEARALQGLVTACEPQKRGREPTLQKELAALQRQHERLQRDHARQQTLVRLAQRSIGLAAPPAAPAKDGKKRRRRPSVRSLRVVEQLQQVGSEATVVSGSESIEKSD